jgi:hypothetical protein
MKVFAKYQSKVYQTLCAVCIGCLFCMPMQAQSGKQLPYPYQEKLLKANEYYKLADYKKAMDIYLIIAEKSGKDTAIMFKIANSFKSLNDPKNAEEWYKKAIVGNEKRLKPFYKLCYAQILTTNGKYKDALHWFKEYDKVAPASDLRAKEAIQSIENITNLYNDTSFYTVAPININTKNTEFTSSFYKDGIVILSDRSSANSHLLSLFYAKSDAAGNFEQPVKFNIAVKAKFNEGPMSFFDHDNKAIYSQNILPENKDKKPTDEIPLQLFQVHQGSDNQWVVDTTLSFTNNKYSYTQPCVSGDGKTVYFVSNMPGGRGGTDLYLSKMQNNQWSPPVNLGSKINTPGDEMFPFLFKDSVLYFSSNGHGGFGGLDIFKIDVKGIGEPENVGAPMNSPYDDFGILLKNDGRNGYFSSNRRSGLGADDIYRFSLIKRAVDVKIVDEKSFLPIEKVEIFTVGPNEKRIGVTDQDGNCTLIIPIDNSLQSKIKKENYETKTYTFQPGNSTLEKLAVIPLKMEDKPIEIAQKTEIKEQEPIKNIFPTNNNFQEPATTKTTEKPKTLVPFKAETKPKEKIIITDENNKPLNNPKNVIYKVQIYASRMPAGEDELKLKYNGNLKINYFYEDRWHKYTIGRFTNYTEAKECLYASMVPDAFIIAYMNNKRVRITVAKAATNETDVEKPVRRYFMAKP